MTTTIITVVRFGSVRFSTLTLVFIVHRMACSMLWTFHLFQFHLLLVNNSIVVIQIDNGQNIQHMGCMLCSVMFDVDRKKFQSITLLWKWNERNFVSIQFEFKSMVFEFSYCNINIVTKRFPWYKSSTFLPLYRNAFMKIERKLLQLNGWKAEQDLSWTTTCSISFNSL